MDGCDVEIGVVPLEIAHCEVGETLRGAVHVEASRIWLERVFPRQGAICCNNASRDTFTQKTFGACLQLSVMVMSFQKSPGAASDPMLSVMTIFFTPASRAASSMRVVPVTAV